LNLSHNRVEDAAWLIPLGGGLRSLEVFTMTHNALENLPRTFAQLRALRVLDVSHNALSLLPEDLFSVHMRSLLRLDLSHNRLRSLPRSLTALPAVRVLYLAENLLVSVPHELQQMSSVRTLHLHSSKMLVVPDCLPPNLLELTLAGVGVNEEYGDVRILQGAVNNALQLQVLSSMLRSIPHRLIVLALGYFSQRPRYRAALADLGALSNLLSVVRNDRLSADVRLEAARAMANLLEVTDDHDAKLYLPDDDLLQVVELASDQW
jgi:Leucine-rich repeat (LRR) protein